MHAELCPHLAFQIPSTLDPLQFVYCCNWSTGDAISTALCLLLIFLENVRMLFINFSSAYNTTAPQRLDMKLRVLSLNSSLYSF